MIYAFKTQAEADAIQGEKFLWYDIGRIVVYTGDDIPRQSAQEQIDQIEGDMPRWARELWLTIIAPTLPADNKRKQELQKIDAQIKELRRKL